MDIPILKLLEQMFLPHSFMRTVRLITGATLVLFASVTHCQKSDTVTSTTAPTPARTPEARDQPVSATVAGRITWDGPELVPQRIRTYKDRVFCGVDGFLELPALTVDPKTNGIAQVLVTVTTVSQQIAFPPETLLSVWPIHFQNCAVSTRVLTMCAGSRLEVGSQDFVAHAVEIFDPFNKLVFERTLSVEGSRATFRPIKPGLYTVRCKEHTWEVAYAWAAQKPFAVLTDANGNFLISKLPLGSYMLNAWHPPVTMLPEEENGRIVRYKPGLPIAKSQPFMVSWSGTISLNIKLQPPGI